MGYTEKLVIPVGFKLHRYGSVGLRGGPRTALKI